MSGLTDRLDDGSLTADEGDVADELNLYFDCTDNACEGESILITTAPTTLQATFGEISGGKNLVGKIAGNDPAGQYKDWNAEGLVGWPGGMSPENLVRAWIGMLDAAAVAFGSPTLNNTLMPMHRVPVVVL